MKKRVLALVMAAALVTVGGCGSSEMADSYKDALSQAQEEFDAEYEKQLAALEGSSADSESSEAETSAPVQEEAGSTESPAPEETEADPDAPVESGTYEVDGIRVMYYASVRNDSTGNWRLGVISDSADLKSYVVDYYKFFCRDDSEVHGIVNLGLGTTARISKVMSDTLEVSVLEYQDGEEHDAKLLYSGDELGRFWINMETLEVDPIEAGE